MTKVIITGGTGFLGVHLSRLFLSKKYKVVLLDIAELTAQDLKGKVQVENVDVRDKQKVLRVFLKHKPDYVVHAAAALPIQNSEKLIKDININGTRNILEASFKSRAKRLVFISSTAMYGVPKHLPETETSPISPIGYYGASKAEGEKLCFSYYKKGLSVNIIRPKTFLGPERLGIFTLWFEAIYNNKPVFILGSGNNLYQLLAVSDVAQAIFLGLTAKKDGEIFNIGSEKFGTWREDLGALIKHAKSKSKILGFPVLPSELALSILEKLNLSPIAAWHYKTIHVDSYVSIEKAKKILKFNPQKSNQDLLEENYDWYKKHRKEFLGRKGVTHRTVWNFKILDLFTRFF